jgi:hypothetical protein
MPEKDATSSLTVDGITAAAGKFKRHEKEAIITELMPVSLKKELSDRYWPKPVREKLGLRVPAVIFLQDPLVAKRNPDLGLQEVELDWEPGFTDGPTSARVAVVDFDADESVLTKPAHWDKNAWSFEDPAGKPISREDTESFQFHQVSVWAVVERVLRFYESESTLGRAVPWAFEGNRLIVVPHAGYGENAYYDRSSKSLQFYYCGSKEKPVYTCLSHDIVAHETGHAVLDGIRPHYNMLSSVQTGAFHEFVADLTAILLALRNNDIRHALARATEGDLSKDAFIAHLAEEFARQVVDRDYLRTAHSDLKMKDIRKERSPHRCSQVLTGAAFDIMKELAADYGKNRGKSPRTALWNMTDRVRRVLLQPLDYCPPVDVQFEDYVSAVIRRPDRRGRAGIRRLLLLRHRPYCFFQSCGVRVPAPKARPVPDPGVAGHRRLRALRGPQAETRQSEIATRERSAVHVGRGRRPRGLAVRASGGRDRPALLRWDARLRLAGQPAQLVPQARD